MEVVNFVEKLLGIGRSLKQDVPVGDPEQITEADLQALRYRTNFRPLEALVKEYNNSNVTNISSHPRFLRQMLDNAPLDPDPDSAA